MYGTEPRLVGGRYELGGGIGYGGMAEVYRGRDVRLGRDVAVKVLRSDLARDPNFLKRFQREAQSAAGLNHPAIVSVYDTGEDLINGSRLPYIVMEFVEGRTLREVLQREGPIPERRAMEITSDICAALDYSHRLGIIHRDIKPANVMLTPDGVVKVMDFGIAKASNATSSTMTATQAVIGTAQYLSPEQARGAKVGPASDVYSTGVLLYELLTGEPPFRGDNPVAVAYQHVRELPDPPSRRNPQLSAVADAVTLKALEKEIENRYSTAGEMRDDLERALSGRRVLAQQQPPGRPSGGSMAATQIAGRPGGYQDDYRRDDTDYRDTGYRDTGGYQETAYANGGYGGRGGYDEPRGRSGYTDQFDRFAPTGEFDRYGQGGAASGPGGQGGPAGPEPRRGSGAWKWVLAGLAVVLTFVVVSLVATSLFSNDSGGKGDDTATTQETIPGGLIGQPPDVVKTRLSDLGFTNFQEEQVTNADAEPDTVTAIDPPEGQKVDKTTTIKLTIAVAPDAVEVPNVVGQSEQQATQTLTDAGFEVNSDTFSGTATRRPGQVEDTNPKAGQRATPGTEVTIYVVSSSVNVGDYRGRQVSVAIAEIEKLGLKYTIDEQLSADKQPGTVIDQTPANATVERGDTITLVVAKQVGPTQTSGPPPTSPNTSPSPTSTPTATITLPGGGGGSPTG
ncbi:Stk1 family PASTA domain-containing Ser/Thr kinase [Frankia sp. CNm7]|uniref:non-specific serine/threonine protein kinase n=2 Tax=Frankia nepalensis TaxID=1836974 RepID=A0A937RFR9_9ACTN|nr:Stk1 family PASTA domain-containing Ser/Thr kinase [Frankia nepalensis]MBL7516400.1 Stk1 family PASTA domain-containing Ser/Thr kinase [Frankia nepalensis]MBL7521042.1 Stk1 family PASTA domain-containing Ser/Thr kinase [Frankia nepalensis]MBL7626589.1 Stk1 family PASTA domain-containing Ser/Thr kinase [Frankia nepalensis]